MVVKLASLAVASAADGTWETSSSIPGVSFRVRSINYPAFTIARDHMEQRQRRQYRGAVPPDVMSGALGLLVAEHLLLDWKGFDEEYSKERAKELLTDPEYSELVSAVVQVSITAATAKIEYLDDAAKNSVAPSATS